MLLCGLVLLLQLTNLFAVLATVSKDVELRMQGELTEASQLLVRLMEQRSDSLLTSAQGLAADFEFRSALTSQDQATILSALANNVASIDADLASYISKDGSLVGASETLDEDRDLYDSLAALAEAQGATAQTLVIGEYAKVVVSVPIRASLTIGWLVLGFSLDEEIAKALAGQVGMQLTFASGDPLPRVFGSSFTEAYASQLPLELRRMQHSDSAAVTTLNGEAFLTEFVAISAHGNAPVVAVLQVSLDAALASYRGVRQRLLMYMTIGLILAFALGLWFARGVTQPLKLLSRAASCIREGDYQTELLGTAVSGRNDEFGELVQSFGDMQQGIANREATITRHAYYDELTDLPNLRLARDELIVMAEYDHSGERPIGLILLALNHYRQIVDTLGHPVGEQMICELSNRLEEVRRQVTLAARSSTDEFLLLVADCDAEELAHLARLAIDTLQGAIVLGDAELIPELSAGLVLMPDHASHADDAIRRASIALADAREAKSDIGYYSAGRDENYLRRLSIVADLKRAVELNELTVHYQPKISMRTMQAESAEALVRWIHPEHGFMPPDEFIGLAERSGNIGLLTQWVLNAVVTQLAAWAEMGIELKVAVNLSALDLQDETLFSRLVALLDLHGVAPTKLIVEVTESAMVKDTDRALAILAQMRAYGLAVSIDDFGTGYSSLAKLKELPIDELKIDRAFVSDIEPGTDEAVIIKGIIDLGHSLGLTIISEGVETQTEWDLLNALGNDVVQGYYISRPLSVEDFNQWWIEHHRAKKRHAA